MLRTLAILTVVVAAVGCGADIVARSPDAGPEIIVDAGPCERDPCACCGSTEVCYEGVCCEPHCAPGSCATDGCGGPCTCQPGLTCEAGTLICRCVPESDKEICERMRVVCGTVDATDNCNQPRTVNCNLCEVPSWCDHTHPDCRCDPESLFEFCARLGFMCGEVTGLDNCHIERTYDCGDCAPGMPCDSATHMCGDMPESDQAFCASRNAQCGVVTGVDNLNLLRTADCGSCPNGQACNSQTNRCVVPETDIEFCLRHEKDCDDYTGEDNTGTTRTVNCGQCPNHAWCDHNRCMGDPPETDQALCANNGAECGSLTAVDNVGSTRTVDCGTCAPGLTCDLATHHCQ